MGDETTAFTSTKWASSKDKEKFAKKMMGFITEGMAEGKLTKEMYSQLMHMFGHIAHYDLHGFRAEWFSSTESKLRFLENILAWSPMGDPTFTWSDVEAHLAAWLAGTTLVQDWREKVVLENEEKERAEYQRLESRLKERPARSAPDTQETRAIRRDGYRAGVMAAASEVSGYQYDGYGCTITDPETGEDVFASETDRAVAEGIEKTIGACLARLRELEGVEPTSKEGVEASDG